MAQKHNAINVRGFNPALPPGMTERVDPNSNGQMNGHDTAAHEDDCVVDVDEALLPT